MLFAYKVRGLEFKVFHSLLFSSVSGLGCFMLDLSPVAQRVVSYFAVCLQRAGFRFIEGRIMSNKIPLHSCDYE